MIRFILAGLMKKFKAMGFEAMITSAHATSNTYPTMIIQQKASTDLANSRILNSECFKEGENDEYAVTYIGGGETLVQMALKIYDTSFANVLKINQEVKRELRNPTMILDLKNIELDLTGLEKQSLFDINSVVNDSFEMEIFYEKEENFTYTDSGKTVWAYIQTFSLTYTELPIKVDKAEGLILMPEVELRRI